MLDLLWLQFRLCLSGQHWDWLKERRLRALRREQISNRLPNRYFPKNWRWVPLIHTVVFRRWREAITIASFKTFPWCNLTQRRPSLSSNLKRANVSSHTWHSLPRSGFCLVTQRSSQTRSVASRNQNGCKGDNSWQFCQKPLSESLLVRHSPY